TQTTKVVAFDPELMSACVDLVNRPIIQRADHFMQGMKAFLKGLRVREEILKSIDPPGPARRGPGDRVYSDSLEGPDRARKILPLRDDDDGIDRLASQQLCRIKRVLIGRPRLLLAPGDRDPKISLEHRFHQLGHRN